MGFWTYFSILLLISKLLSIIPLPVDPDSAVKQYASKASFVYSTLYAGPQQLVIQISCVNVYSYIVSADHIHLV